MPSKKLGKPTSDSKTDPRLIPLGLPPKSRIVKVLVTPTELKVRIHDGRWLVTPLDWYPTLKAAAPAQRRSFRISAKGFGISWEALDFDLSLEGMLAGNKEALKRKNRVAA